MKNPIRLFENSVCVKPMKSMFVACSISFFCIVTSCENFLAVDLPDSKIDSKLVFSDDVTATSAIYGIYEQMLNPVSFASGSSTSIIGLAGLSADEFNDYYEAPGTIDFEQNTLTPQNDYLPLYWNSAYKTIYQANSVIEGLAASANVTSATKNQLEGEALFVRAFSHFYLVNLFGDVPLVLTTDYKANSLISRKPASEVYEQIVADLLTAQGLLNTNYIAAQKERIRPNQSAATALLARVYLYLGDWMNAEIQSTSVIENSLYDLVADLNSVFLKNSKEAIWQLRPVLPGFNTNEAYFFAIGNAPQYYTLNDQVVNAFESGDDRLDSWVGSFDTGEGFVYYPYKYKVYEYFDPAESSITEYSIVLRLAEQYLIRAEARAKQGNLSGAIADIDEVRDRAGLSKIQDTDPGISQADLLLAIEHERQVELFTEGGHRWFDLKRTDRADEILSLIKPQWNPEDVLYPIPQSEFARNPKLGNQNLGYSN
jgi:hypothetical protein